MKEFMESKDNTKLKEDDRVGIRATRAYVELELARDEFSIHLYFIPKTEHSMFVVANLDHAFDGLETHLQDADMRTVIVETWPRFAQLLVNGMEDRYSQGALIRLEDADDGETKWFVASVLGNIDMSNLEEVFGDQGMRVAGKVMETTLEMMQELNEKEIDKVRAYGRSILSGVLSGIKSGFKLFMQGTDGISMERSGGSVTSGYEPLRRSEFFDSIFGRK